MSAETVINNDVQVVIKNPWIWTALTDQGSGIWSGTVTVSANSTFPYTFVNGGQDTWSGEESVPAACNMGSEGAPERHITVAGVDTTLSVVAFGSCGPNVSVISFDEGDMLIYPNPANDVINISSSDGSISSIKIIDMTGRILISKRAINDRNISLEVGDLENGIYSVITESESERMVSKIIINH